VTAVDLGSNTLRVLQFDCKIKKSTAIYEKVVKTADGLAEYGFVNDEAVLRVVSALKEAQRKIDFSSEVKAVTTEAIRRASNADAVLKKIQKKTGISFDVITGEEEARLTLLAVKDRLLKLQNASKSFVLVDIGGGSTEVTFHYATETISKSFPIGIVTMAQTYGHLENIEKALPRDMLDIQMFCSEILATKGSLETYVATAGTPTTVAAMKLGFNHETYDAAKINGTSLHKEELDVHLENLLSMSFEEREIAVGTGRSDLIAAGILIYKQLYKILDFNTCIVVDDGLREGVALDYCEKRKYL
jgi:exopolyphosphatase/guanosine-5'-triphosphate,3'-diphosphate pyrophosphatase